MRTLVERGLACASAAPPLSHHSVILPQRHPFMFSYHNKGIESACRRTFCGLMTYMRYDVM